MTGAQLRRARERLGLSQPEAARRWGVSQPYLSLAEHGHRPVPSRLAALVAREAPEFATGLPLEASNVFQDELPRLLGTLRYPGFAYLADPEALANPAAVLVAALRGNDVPTRVTRALPWLLVRFADENLDFDWLVDRVKLLNLQNRLGYLVSLAGEMAERSGRSATAARLREVEHRLEDARLVREDTLGRTVTEAERRFLRANRPERAAHWNLLTRLTPEDVDDAA